MSCASRHAVELRPQLGRAELNIAVSSDEFAITPMVIVIAATVMDQWAVDLPDDYLITVSESGYSNDKLALDWLQHFNKQTENRRKGSWRLLLVDGHGSHETREFIKYAEDYKIQIFAHPPIRLIHYSCLM
jgi:hypothetical protein